MEIILIFFYKIEWFLSKKLKNSIFVHRDFHISNLMINKNKLGIIDSQDATIGNPLYDVVSVIDDVRIKTLERPVAGSQNQRQY